MTWHRLEKENAIFITQSNWFLVNVYNTVKPPRLLSESNAMRCSLSFPAILAVHHMRTNTNTHTKTAEDMGKKQVNNYYSACKHFRYQHSDKQNQCKRINYASYQSWTCSGTVHRLPYISACDYITCAHGASSERKCIRLYCMQCIVVSNLISAGTVCLFIKENE